MVDLSAIDYVSSAGVRALADASGQASRAGLGMTVCGLQEPGWLAMDLAGLVPELAVEPSRSGRSPDSRSSGPPGVRS